MYAWKNKLPFFWTSACKKAFFTIPVNTRNFFTRSSQNCHPPRIWRTHCILISYFHKMTPTIVDNMHCHHTTETHLSIWNKLNILLHEHLTITLKSSQNEFCITLVTLIWQLVINWSWKLHAQLAKIKVAIVN